MSVHAAQARAVLADFLLPGAIEQQLALGNAGGFSGASLWRITTRSGAWCLRGWPPQSISVDRLRQLHALQQRAAVLPFVPRLLTTHAGTTWVEHNRRLWELSSWQPGCADYHTSPTPTRLRAACRALAQLHDCWRHEAPLQVAPAVRRRLEAYQECVRNPEIRRPEESLCSAFPPLRRASVVLEEHLATLPALLQPWLQVPCAVQPCLCDCWHDHLLFTGDALTGLIDYGAVKLDQVAVDLARLLGSLVGDDANAWQVGLAAYREVRTLSFDEERLARTLDRTGRVLALWTWLCRLRQGVWTAADQERINQRLRDLLATLTPARD